MIPINKNERLQKLLSNLPVFDQLDAYRQNKIQQHKKDFSFEKDLRDHLGKLGFNSLSVGRLSKFIVWIPYHQFKTRRIAGGGFGVVSKGTIEAKDEHGLFTATPRRIPPQEINRKPSVDFALKEMENSFLISEVRIYSPIFRYF